MSDNSLGMRRRTQSHEAILKATYELLKEIGFQNLTIEGVAARAKVGKTTIYRWWNSKGALAVESFLKTIEPSIHFEESTSARKDISLQMSKLANVFESKEGVIIKEILATAQFDKETLSLFQDGFLTPRRLAAKQILQKGVNNGEFKADIDFELILDALYGPIYYRLLTGSPSNDILFLRTIENFVMSTLVLDK
ncbi:TetR/AcrR family transcriptional regulator [Acinetobacter sp. AS167]|uniref:TetR/AcrR family transcriptional regulator n=1 Tax=Acinetobacter sp. AS167 TaxID=3127884 RepID=UPI00301725B9